MTMPTAIKDPVTALRQRAADKKDFARMSTEERAASGPYADYRISRRNDVWLRAAIRRVRETLEEWKVTLVMAERDLHLNLDWEKECPGRRAVLERIRKKADSHCAVNQTRLDNLLRVEAIRSEARAEAHRHRVPLTWDATGPNATIRQLLREGTTIRSEAAGRVGDVVGARVGRADCIRVRLDEGRPTWTSFDFGAAVEAFCLPDYRVVVVDAVVETVKEET